MVQSLPTLKLSCPDRLFSCHAFTAPALLAFCFCAANHLELVWVIFSLWFVQVREYSTVVVHSLIGPSTLALQNYCR